VQLRNLGEFGDFWVFLRFFLGVFEVFWGVFGRKMSVFGWKTGILRDFGDFEVILRWFWGVLGCFWTLFKNNMRILLFQIKQSANPNILIIIIIICEPYLEDVLICFGHISEVALILAAHGCRTDAPGLVLGGFGGGFDRKIGVFDRKIGVFETENGVFGCFWGIFRGFYSKFMVNVFLIVS
jgi:hypothetical protein